MPPPPPAVLWPAPGWPAVLGPGQDEVELLVSHDGTAPGELHAWVRGLALGAHDGVRTELAIRAIEPLASPARDARVGPAVRALGVTRVARLRASAAGAPAPRPPARARVFDLLHGDTCVRPRCVARHAPAGPLRIAFASDLHHAALWDEVHADLERFAPDLAERALHPNTQVRRLVAELAARAARGELDAVVLGGDLVDHVYRVPRAACRGRADDTNLPGLLDALAPLPVPCFAIPGNHDHRLHPWRPRAYGLAEIGVPWRRLRGLLRAAGRWDPWPLRWRDLDALRTRERDGRDALAHHLALVAPAVDFTATLGGLRLVFLSTGRDALCRWRSVERGRGRVLLRSLPSSWELPDSEGLHDEQIAGLARALAAAPGGAAVFLHAPVLHPRGPVEARLPRLDPGDGDDGNGLAARVRFERALFARGLRRGVFFRNAAPFLRALREAPGPAGVLSGHVHRAHAWRWDPERADARSCSWPVAGGPGVTFAGAPAVAHVPPGEPGRFPGYLLASFEGGALRSLEVVPLPAGAGSNAEAACQPRVS